MQSNDRNDILVVENVSKEYKGNAKLFKKEHSSVKAVADVSFKVREGETFGIVGESGCGKTTLGKCIVRLHQPTSGRMWFRDGNEKKDLLSLDSKDSFRLRRKIQIIFQDPYSSLNPMHNILEAFDEPLRIHNMGNKAQRQEIVAKALEEVNLLPDFMYRYPNEFSGGQRQRICIAKALAMKPDMIVCDEPVSALDVSIQAQIMNLMRQLQKEHNLTFLFIAHDLSVVQYMSDRIAVMYLGKIVEIADAEELHVNHKHPYTEALLSAVPVPLFGQKKERIILQGDVPSPINPPSGCKFHPRCRNCMDICKTAEPQLRAIGDGEHMVACHLYDDIPEITEK